MAIDAVVALSATATQVPVAIHPAVGALLVISILDAMALGTQLDHLVKIQCFTVGQMQTGTVLVVAGVARLLSVGHLKAFVKAFGRILG
jgi:hypothetical protein